MDGSRVLYTVVGGDLQTVNDLRLKSRACLYRISARGRSQEGSHRLQLAVGGRYAKLHFGVGRDCPGGAVRSEVTEFSSSSRKRLLDLLHQVDQGKTSRALFITLTYPSEYPTEGAVFKGHLRAWFERLKRKYSGVSAIWRLEFQSRGAPHFHVLLFNLPVNYLDKAWLSQSWFEVVGSGDRRHLLAGTNVGSVCERWLSVAYYASKYVAAYTGKAGGVPAGVECPGRFWGVLNRAGLPVELVSVDLSEVEYFSLRRTFRNFIVRVLPGQYVGGRRGLTVYMDVGRVWALLRSEGIVSVSDDFTRLQEVGVL